MTKKYFLSLTFLMISFFGFSQTEYLDGVLVLNEGNMGTSAANISFVSGDNTVTNGVFSNANSGATMGDVGQSIMMYEDIAIIVMNGSNEVHFVNNKTFELIATVNQGVTFPRYAAVYDNKAYITCWGSGTDPDDDYVAVIDLTTYQLENTISLPEGVENIIEVDGKLYIAHQGGYGYGNTISVYNTETEEITTLQVGDLPREFVKVDDYLYVVCAGMPSWTGNATDASLVRIDVVTDTIEETITFESGFSAYHSAYKNGYIYISAGANVYRFDLGTGELENSVFIATEVTDFLGIYGLDIVDDKIYVSDAAGYTGAGFVYVYSLEGSLLNTLTVGNIPSNVVKSAQSENASVTEQVIANIAVYPNPATDIFYVESKTEMNVNIYDLTGKKVKQNLSSQNGINISDLSRGIYLIEISNATQKQVNKLIVR